MEQSTNINQNDNKRKGLLHLLLGALYFISIILSNLAIIFKPIYTHVSYGRLNEMIFYIIASVILTIFVVTILLISRLKYKVQYKKNKEPLSLLKEFIIWLIIIVSIFIVSAIIGFNVKIFYQLGDSIKINDLFVLVAKVIYIVLALFTVTFMIEEFQYSSDYLIPNHKYKEYVPYGGILCMLTFGIYCFFVDLTSLEILYMFFCIIYGIIYNISNRRIIVTLASIILIFLL